MTADKKEKINRIWEMPNSKTFRINCVKNIILKYLPKEGMVIDPFANDCSIINFIPAYLKYVSNDLDTEYKTDFNLEAQDFMKKFENNSVNLVLFDPPYSGRQVSECYKKLGKTVNMSDTNSGYFVKFKEEISRIVKDNGYVITCGWNTNGVGKKYGFEIVEILLVAHGGNHNDTIITIERKVQKRLK